MGCDGFREALSARLDGEALPVGAAELDAHLADCPDCRRWSHQAAAVTRLARTGPAAVGVDVTAAVLPAAPRRWRGRLEVLLRVALGAVGTAQLVLGLLQLTVLRPVAQAHVHGTTPDGATPSHLWHESAAWNVAVGAGFVWVAARRGRPGGIVPILTAFLGVLVLLSVLDILAGQVELARLASHLLMVVGYLIVVALTRPALQLTPPGQGGRAAGRHTVVPDGPALPDEVTPLPRRDRDPPAARRNHAA